MAVAGQNKARRSVLPRAGERRGSRRLELDFPAKLVTAPLLYQLVKKYDLMPNIRRANVTQEFGYIQLELVGREESLRKGVRVEPITKDVLES